MTNASLWVPQIHFLVSMGFLTLFVLIELGLSWTLLFFKLGALVTKEPRWTEAYRFWVRVFALAAVLAFGATIPVLIQFGSLWPMLMERIGEIAGPLLAAAMLTTFIFKSCFLGAMLFGQRQLSERIHAVVVAMVAVGTTLAAWCVVVLQSWMQTPSGAALINGDYLVTSWADIASNPSMPWLAALLGVCAMLTVAFLLLGVSARQSLRHPLSEGEALSFRSGLNLALVGVMLLVVAVAGYGQITARHQPAKAAATAGYWQSGAPTDFVLLGWPDTDQERTHFAIRLPGAASSWLGRDQEGQAVALDRYSAMHAPVPATFWSFRIILVVGLLMALVAMYVRMQLRGRDADPSKLKYGARRILSLLTLSGWVLGAAVLCHLLFGLSPWVVSDTITLLEVTGPAQSTTLAITLIAYLIVYALFLRAFVHMLRHISFHGVIPVARHRGRA